MNNKTFLHQLPPASAGWKKIIEIVPGFSPTNKLNKAIWAKARNFTVHFDPLTKAWLAARGQFAGKPMAIDFTNRSESNRTRTTGK